MSKQNRVPPTYWNALAHRQEDCLDEILAAERALPELEDRDAARAARRRGRRTRSAERHPAFGDQRLSRGEQ